MKHITFKISIIPTFSIKKAGVKKLIKTVEAAQEKALQHLLHTHPVKGISLSHWRLKIAKRQHVEVMDDQID
jgi:hypothetical protein